MNLSRQPTNLILSQNTISGVTTSMEIFTPEAVLELLSTLVPLLSRPPFSSSTLEKVAWKYSIYLYLHPGILYERLFSSAWLSVQGPGEGGWASGEDQPFCSWPTTGGAVTCFLVNGISWNRDAVRVLLSSLLFFSGSVDQSLPRLQPGHCSETSAVGGLFY